VKFGSITVRTPDGKAREYPIDLPSIVVGRADGNGIVIDDLSISRRHARIVVESGRLLVEDLGSSAGTYVGGHKVDPGTPNLVEVDQGIRFGDVEVKYTPPPPVTAAEREAGVAADGSALPDFEEAPSRAISVTLTSPATPVEPGGAVFATAVVQNRGRVVDLVTLGVTGIPAAWVTFSQTTMALVPGARETVTIVIQPPVSPDSLAGEYDFGIVVGSGEHDREALAFGKVTISAFESCDLSLVPVRSKRDFLLVAKNTGNDVATYALSGVDDEGDFIFEFDAPTIELQPGQERRIPFKVRKRKRRWFGKPEFLPLRVIATPTTAASGDATAVQTQGQLVVTPPLEKWKGPTMLAIVLTILGVGAWWSFENPEELPSWVPWSEKDGNARGTDEGEAAYAGVHMCDKTEEERSRTLARATPPPAGTTGSPYFAQNNPAWADIEYAKAQDPEFGPDWCGTTIEQCGCAMTSVATIMAMFQIATMPDGKELTPQTVNAWFNEEARKTSRGWVSKGYIYGDVIWTAANELSAQIAKQRPGTPTIRFAGFGPGTEEEIRAELQAGRPLVLEVPGHYIAAVGLDGEKILINDPYYADRKTLDAYKGKVKGSVHFEPSNDLSAVVITVPKDLRVRVLDKQGKIVGSLNTEPSTSPAPVGIEGAYLSSRDAWRDPTCVESPPPAGAGTTSIFLPGKREDYRIEVLNPSTGGTSVAIHSYDQDGNSSLQTQDSTGPSVIGMSYDPAQATPQLQVIQGTPPGSGTPTPGTGGTPQLPPGGGNTGGNGGVTNPSPTPAAAAPSPSPTATRTPQPTPTPVVPQAVTVQCNVVYTGPPPSAGVTCTGNVSGTYTTTRWSLNGLPAPVPPGSTAFNTTFTQDTSATVEMTACNITVCKTGSASVVVKFTTATPTPSATPVPGTPTPVPPTPAVGPPPAVHVECTWSGTGPGAEINCTTQFSEAFNSITWNATNASPASLTTGAKHFQTFRVAEGDVMVTATVCLGSTCTVSAPAFAPTGPPGGPMAMTLGSNACGTLFQDFVVTLVVYLFSWTSGDPYPTGTVDFFVDGNSVGTGSILPGEPMAQAVATIPTGSGIPFAATYSGDANWLSSSLTCTFDNFPP